jgi:hypothetical protein
MLPSFAQKCRISLTAVGGSFIRTYKSDTQNQELTLITSHHYDESVPPRGNGWIPSNVS